MLWIKASDRIQTCKEVKLFLHADSLVPGDLYLHHRQSIFFSCLLTDDYWPDYIEKNDNSAIVYTKIPCILRDEDARSTWAVPGTTNEFIREYRWTNDAGEVIISRSTNPITYTISMYIPITHHHYQCKDFCTIFTQVTQELATCIFIFFPKLYSNRKNNWYGQLLDHSSYLRECLLKCCAFKIYPCYSTF